MINYFKKLFNLERKVVMVDYENRIAHFTTHSYPEKDSLLILIRNGKPEYLIVNDYTLNGDVYNLQTANGLYLLRYL
jgi:hypothetical protein